MPLLFFFLPLKILVIGDGFGFLSAFMHQVFPNSLIFLVDLGKTLLLQAHYCQKSFPKANHHFVEDEKLSVPPSGFIYCPAEKLEKLSDYSFDWAFNIASMQEMNQKTIQMYFDFLRKNLVDANLFYCCNREEKILPGGEVIRFNEYPWSLEDIILVDEQCPWGRFFVSFKKTSKQPSILGRQVSVSHYDGSIRHRLIRMKVEG